MGERHKHADVIIAWANGATIQYRDPEADDGWHTVSSEWDKLGWFDDHEYRVKPSVVTKWIWAYRIPKTGKWRITDHRYTEPEVHTALSGFYSKLVRIEESAMEEEYYPTVPANPRPHADIIRAWAEGEDIQFWCFDKWINVTEESPIWSPERKYRIKPKTVTKWYWAFRTNDGKWGTSRNPYTEEEVAELYPNMTATSEIHKIEASKIEVEE